MIPFAFSLEKPLCENNNTLLNVFPPFYMLIKLRVREFVPYVLRASTRPYGERAESQVSIFISIGPQTA